MANKMVVIPADVYTSLMDQDRRFLQNPHDSSLTALNMELTQTLNNPALNNDEKYAKYDQIIKRIKNILDAKKEAAPENKIYNAISSLANQQKNEIPVQHTKQIIKIVPRKKHFTIKSKKTAPPATSNDDTTMIMSPDDSDNKSTASKSEEFLDASEEHQSTSLTTPTVPVIQKRSRPQWEKEKKLLDYIQQNASRFGISKDSRVLKDSGSPYKGSDVKKIVEGMVATKESGHPKPPGYQQLHNLLYKDPKALEILNKSPKSQQKGKGGIIFKPAIWKKF